MEAHARALVLVATKGVLNETYNIGGYNEMQNIDVVWSVCTLLEELVPSNPGGINSDEDLITNVTDRAGHDMCYAIDASKIQRELGWSLGEIFESVLRKTVQWYLDNKLWCDHVKDGIYQRGYFGGKSYIEQ